MSSTHPVISEDVKILQFQQRLQSFIKDLEVLKKLIEDYSKKTFVFKIFSDLKIN